MSSNTATTVARKRAASTKTGVDARPTVPTADNEKEVYETPDVEETDFHDAEDGATRSGVTSADIDATAINPVASFEKFAGKTFNLSRTVYEESLDRPTTFAVDTYSYLPKNERKFESPIETYQRLKKEVALLIEEVVHVTEEMEKNKDPNALTPFPPNLLTDLRSLQQALTAVAVDKRLGGILSEDEVGVSPSLVNTNNVLSNIKALTAKPGPGASAPAAGSGNSVTYEVYLDRLGAGTATSGDSMTDEQLLLSQINQRITSLENVVGSAAVITPTRDLKSLTTELYQRTQLLDVNHLAIVQARVQKLTDTLAQTLENPQNQRKGTPGLAKGAAQKVDMLYDMMTKLEGTLDEVPVVIARLQSLQRIHEAGAQFVSDFQKLQTQQNSLTTMLQTQSKSLAEVEGALATNFETIMSNFKNIQTRMEALEKKVGK